MRQILFLAGTAIINGDPVVSYTAEWLDAGALAARNLYTLNLTTGKQVEILTNLDREVLGLSVGSGMIAVEVADGVDQPTTHDIAFFTLTAGSSKV